MTKKQERRKMIKNAIAFIESLGAYPSDYLSSSDVPRYEIVTKYGPMTILFDPDEHSKGCAKVTAFCKFAKTNPLGSPHSGKWNWHALDAPGLLWWLENSLKPIVGDKCPQS